MWGSQRCLVSLTRLGRLESHSSVRSGTDSCTNFVFIVELFKSKSLISSCFSVEECWCLCNMKYFSSVFLPEASQRLGFLHKKFIVATKQKEVLSWDRGREKRVNNKVCIFYLTEDFFRDFLTMRLRRASLLPDDPLFFMCCIHFFKDAIYITCIKWAW